MADSAHTTTSTVIPLPGAGPYAGKRWHRDKLEQRRYRELLLTLIEENRLWIAKHQAAIASRNAHIGELLADLRKLDGYRSREHEIN